MNKKLVSVDIKLSQLHKDAMMDPMRMGGAIKSIFRPLKPTDVESAYLAISDNQGKAIRNMIVKRNLKTVVEFGTSFGISTLYMADAARQIEGKVITTELLESKAKKALSNFEEVGLSEYIDLRIGDAMQSLKDFNEPIDFLFLDGWKDLYLPLFKMLEPNFHEGTVIYADNADMPGVDDYLSYVKSKSEHSSKYVHGKKGFLTDFR